jgi:hypothetical protein
MALCPKCRKRLGKRSCPALGFAICQRCCGVLREREIHCPPACPHLSAHRPYQEKRVMERGPTGAGPGRTGRKDLLEDERLAWLALHIEAALAEQAAANPDFEDKDALFAVEYARAKTEKGPARLIIPGEALKPVNAAGEAVLRAVEACRYQGSSLLAPGTDAYRKEEKLACLERIAWSVRTYLRGKMEGQAYLTDLSRRFARSGAGPKDQKLVTLT